MKAAEAGLALGQMLSKKSKSAINAKERRMVVFKPTGSLDGSKRKNNKSGGGPRLPPGRGKLEFSANSREVFAPVANGFVTRGVETNFSAAPVKNGLHGVRLSGRQIWCTIVASATVANTGEAIVNSNGVHTTNLSFDPDDTATMPPPMTALGAIFARYCLRRCIITFTPAAATSDTTVIALAVTSDAAQASTTFTSNSTNAFGLSEISDSILMPVWTPGRLEVPCDDALRYTYQSVADGSLSVAEKRQDHAFVMSAATGVNWPTASKLYGYIHIDYVMDFYELGNWGQEVSILRLKKRLFDLEHRVAPFLCKAPTCLERKEETALPVAGRSDAPRTESKDSVVEDSDVSPSAGWTRLSARELRQPHLDSLDLKKVQARSISSKG
jgi:hypothetical protein